MEDVTEPLKEALVSFVYTEAMHSDIDLNDKETQAQVVQAFISAAKVFSERFDED